LIFLYFCLISTAFVAFRSGCFWCETDAVQPYSGVSRNFRSQKSHDLQRRRVWLIESTIGYNFGCKFEAKPTSELCSMLEKSVETGTLPQLAEVERMGDLHDVASPPVSAEEAGALASEHYGLNVHVQALVGERDRNFHLRADDGREFVLKIIHPAEDPEVSDFQSRMLMHVEEKDPELPTPRVVRSRDGAHRVLWQKAGLPARWVRCLTYLDGVPLYQAERSPAQKRNLGTFLGRLDSALQGFRHAAEDHDLIWDTKKALRVRHLLVHVPEREKRAAANVELDRFAERLEPIMSQMRTQIIHNDFNPHNVLVQKAHNEVIAGVIDFGDAVRSPVLQDLAVASAYHFETTGHPLEGPRQVAEAFHAVYPLSASEVALLPDLIGARFALAIAISYWRAAKHPNNAPYIMRNQIAAWFGLRRLNEVPRQEAGQWLQDKLGIG